MGALGAAGLAVNRLVLPPAPSASLASVQSLSAQFYNSLDSSAKDEVCVPYNHPYRQYHNRGVWGGGARIHALSFDRSQRQTLTDLLHAGLSSTGREVMPDQFFINWPGVHLAKVLICGDPNTNKFQTILTGPHLNLRLGGQNDEGVAFGGPQIYGDQRGNEDQGLPGNRYRFQFLLAHALYQTLTPAQQAAATLETTPVQTQIEVQGRGAQFPGIPIGELSADSMMAAVKLVNGLLSVYPTADSAYAWRCLDHNGGIGAIHVSYYTQGEVDGSGQYQIFRLEGPGSVFFFLGYPHVHGFINVAMDAESPLSVGEVVGNNPQVLAGKTLKQFFEKSMIAATGADFAYYPDESAVGRLRSGTIRTGDIYNAESWQDRLVTVQAKGGDLRGELRSAMKEVLTLESGQLYKIAVSGFVADELLSDYVIQARSTQPQGLMRDAIISYAQSHGFGSTGVA